MMHIWDNVKTPQTQYIKEVEYGPNLAAIDSYYMFMLATKQFGPCGDGWGYDILEEDYKDVGPILSAEKEIGRRINHTVKVKLWYLVDSSSKPRTVTHYGTTKYTYFSSGYVVVDEEAPKKSLTDAIKKCLSMLGFCADVYMGKFQDSDYVSGVKSRQEAEKEVEEEERIRDLTQELRVYTSNEIKTLSAVPIASVDKLGETIKRKVKNKCLGAGINPDKFITRVQQEIESVKSNQQKSK